MGGDPEDNARRHTHTHTPTHTPTHAHCDAAQDAEAISSWLLGANLLPPQIWRSDLRNKGQIMRDSGQKCFQFKQIWATVGRDCFRMMLHRAEMLQNMEQKRLEMKAFQRMCLCALAAERRRQTGRRRTWRVGQSESRRGRRVGELRVRQRSRERKRKP